MNSWIVCAAIRHPDGRIVCGARHFDDVMRSQIGRRNAHDWVAADQGFIDQFGHFHTREEAWEIAHRNQQIRRNVSIPGTLYSENIY